MLSLQLLPLGHRQLIAAVVEGVVGVALYPVEVDGVDPAQLQQPLPQVGVQGGLLVRLRSEERRVGKECRL